METPLFTLWLGMALGEMEDSEVDVELAVAAPVARTVPAVAPASVDINCLRFISFPLFPNCVSQALPGQITRTISKEQDDSPAITGSLPARAPVVAIVVSAGGVPVLDDAVGAACIKNPAEY